MSFPTRAAAVDRTLAWATDGGARFDALDLRVDAAGCCAAFARRPIAAGERVVTVPRRLMVMTADLTTTATGAVDPYGPALDSDPDTLATWLALELACEGSPWRPYLDGLPAELPALPLLRADADLDELAGTDALRAARAARKTTRDLYGVLRPALRARLSFAAWTWGLALVGSRGYTVVVDGRPRAALIPIADLLDHRPGDTRWGFVPAEAAYAIDAVRAIDAGEPVHASYGALSNARLLIRYGFALDDNPDDEAGLVFPSATVGVGRRADDRWRRARELAGEPAGVRAAARAGLDRLGRHPSEDEGWLADPARSAWERACAHVRRGERAVLEAISSGSD